MIKMDGIIGHGNPLVDRYPQEVFDTIVRKQKEHEERISSTRLYPKIKIFKGSTYEHEYLEKEINTFLTKHKILSLSSCIYESLRQLIIIISYE